MIALKNSTPKDTKLLFLRDKSGKLAFIHVDLVVAFQSAGRDMLVYQYFNEKIIVSNLNMILLEEKLEDTPFIRVGRSLFINPDHIRDIAFSDGRYSLNMHNATTFNICPKYIETLKNVMFDRHKGNIIDLTKKKRKT